MSMTALLGLSFGVFPCLLFGFIMLLSLLICEYIEEYVANHLCAWKNRRRRGLRSFYRDFRERRNAHNNSGAAQHFTSSRTRGYPSTSTAWVGSGGGEVGPVVDGRIPDGTVALSASAPPGERSRFYGAQIARYSPTDFQLVSVDDSPPSYEECVLPRVRLQIGPNNGNSSANDNVTRNSYVHATAPPKKPSLKKSSSIEKDKDKGNY